jgi:hypothetical protein
MDGANMFRNDNVDEIVAPSLACTRTPTYMPFTNGSTNYFVDENGVGFHGLTSSMTKGKHYKRAYNVSFNSNGGENLDSIYVAFDKNTNISLPTPKYGSRTFLGWFYGNSSSQRANNNMINTVSSSITLYARWDN